MVAAGLDRDDVAVAWVGEGKAIGLMFEINIK